MPQIQYDPAALPAMVNPQAATAIGIGRDVANPYGVPMNVIFQLDPRVAPGDALMLRIFQALANLDVQIGHVQTVIASLPGCGRPIDDLPSLLVASDAMRDSLFAIHAAVDARTEAFAAAQAAAAAAVNDPGMPIA